MKAYLLSFLTLILIIPAFGQQSSSGREIIPFNDQWQFKKADYSKNIAVATDTWQEVTVPHTWNNKDMQNGVKYYTGDAFYKKEFYVDPKLKNKRLFIRFEGVGSVADLYINDKLIGEHRGAYSAFCFEITHSVNLGAKNTFLVKVNNEPRKDVIPINNNLFGVYGGIYRPVELIVTNKVNITTTDYASPGIYIQQQEVSDKKAKILLTAKIENKEQSSRLVEVRTDIKDRSGKVISSEKKAVRVTPQGMSIIHQSLEVSNPHLWNGRKDPYLYSLTTSIIEGNNIVDAVTQPLGLRYFTAVPGKGFYLNGKPYRLYGVCRHQEWLNDGSALSDSQHAVDLNMIYEIGATSIRFAHYQQAAYIYSKCDSLGFVVWAEIPFVNAVSTMEGDNAKQQLRELIRQNYNHPSIYAWGLHNEVYSRSPDGYVPVLTRELNDIAKTEDPGRFTGSVSGYGEMDRPSNLAADIQGMNRYYGWYEGNMTDLEGWVRGLEKNYPDDKVVLSEYGTEANIHQQKQTNQDVQRGDPGGQFWPESFQTRFHEIQWGIIEKHPYLLASYVWNMFDFSAPPAHGGGVKGRNMKGLVTYDRKIKKDAFYWYKANWSEEPVIYIAGRRDTAREHADNLVKVFSNLTNITLYVNGVKTGSDKTGTTKADHLFEAIHLHQGTNTIKAEGLRNGKLYSDTITWHFGN